MPDSAQPTARPWTFENLVRADRATLERLLRAGAAPDFAALEGRLYRGWNHQPITAVTGRKFCKGFRRRHESERGYNELVRRDGRGPEGEWEPKLRWGRPVHLGHFSVARVPGARGGIWARYRNAGLLDYGIEDNAGLHLPLRLIRDFVALPNPGDHDLVVGKAYLHLGPGWLNLFVSYFVLGHPRPIMHERS